MEGPCSGLERWAIVGETWGHGEGWRKKGGAPHVGKGGLPGAVGRGMLAPPELLSSASRWERPWCP